MKTSLLCCTFFSLFGCAGFTQMSDDWCDQHPAAGNNHCHGRGVQSGNEYPKGAARDVSAMGQLAVVPSQSWDQENLKRNDSGCPTAIYVAPHGVLEQC